ncbi:hypothetical protein LTR78_000576 [Recurvomyces mirabilis]|uniref:Uncharacterized protein n=1 Tax=Recurvomyces mirabilis TaxID=574656 RepID=A0AAE0WY57_9PEZI|nr:hypothetical protein LTR78_000576 [Recurvomyces mirabilis]KAK5162231.1 hypothetical protein LTS14_000577 [Recurvomyces mirabilis]
MENSPLARLPPELRNLVYEHALAEDDAYNLMRLFSMSTTPRADSLRVCGLPRTCKDIRAETYGLYFALNKLVLAFDAFDLAEYGIWRFMEVIIDRIRLMPHENARLIRHYVLELDGYSTWIQARFDWWRTDDIDVLIALLHPSAVVQLHINIHFAVGEYPDRRCVCNARVILPLHKPLTIEDEVASQLKEIVATESGMTVVQGMKEIKSSITFLAKDLAVALSRSSIARGT